ncbi:hypothetical protein WJX73_002397 [Symbiochloris irregularis]|uniref:Uncharacterized protein n=1 Tax=Symbiochloris irregularis TaxID=706552 RepID=A0AAW1PV77_9CHLO
MDRCELEGPDFAPFLRAFGEPSEFEQFKEERSLLYCTDTYLGYRCILALIAPSLRTQGQAVHLLHDGQDLSIYLINRSVKLTPAKYPARGPLLLPGQGQSQQHGAV